MIKVEVIKNFTLKDFKKLKNIVRKGKDLEGHLYKEDVFECDEEMAKYLTGNNKNKDVVVKIIEVIPLKTIKEEKPTENKTDDVAEEIFETKSNETKKPKKKKTSKK